MTNQPDKMKNQPYEWPRFRIADPSISGPLTVFPITNGNHADVDYLLLSEAVDKGIVKMKETSSDGTVQVIVVENRGKIPVLGVQGEEYVGAKQNRTLNLSFLVGPGKTEIPVTCVEQGRWAHSSKHFAGGAYESPSIRGMKAAMLRKNITEGISDKFAANQSAVWQAVSLLGRVTGTRSATGAMSDVYENVGDSLKDIVSGIELPEETRGVVVAAGGHVIGADIFEAKFAFDRMWPRLVNSYALDAMDAKGTPPSLEAADTFLHGPCGSQWVATPSVGLGEDVRWEGKGFIAASLMWQGRHIHTSVFAS